MSKSFYEDQGKGLASKESSQIKIKSLSIYEVRIYIGSQEQYNGPKFYDVDLKDAIRLFQLKRGLENSCCVRITPTHYIMGDYEEEGWEIGVINYPRFPKTTMEVKVFVDDLIAHLLERFNQNRISAVFNDVIITYESKNAMNSHKERD